MAWDRIAPGYDRSRHPRRTSGWGTRAFAVPSCVRACDSWTWRPAAGRSASRRRASARRCWRRTSRPSCSSGSSERAREEGLDVETRVMDGHALELDDDSFDMAGSQFGVMLFPDMPKGIGEMARVVKPGGRVLMNVLRRSARDRVLRLLRGRASTPFAPTSPAADGSSSASVSAAGPGEAAPRAGRRRPEGHPCRDDHRGTWTFRSGTQLWDWLTSSNPIAGTVLDALNLTTADIDARRRGAADRMSAERSA